MTQLASDIPPQHEDTHRPGGLGLPFGLLMLLLPPLVAYLWICATRYGGALVLPLDAAFWSHLQGPTLGAALLYGGWFLFQVALQLWLPGPEVEGAALADGSRLRYRMNGWAAFCVTMLTALGLCATGLVPATLLADQFGPLLSTVNLFAFGYAAYLYARGQRPGAAPSLRDYFLGTELNPRSGAFDHKLFCEARPGLLLWVLLDLSLAAKQRALHGSINTSMILVCAFQLWYVADYYRHEEAILSTWDIKYERFGWMLCWGDLCWVPFTYSLQALYLAHHPRALPPWAVALLLAGNALGYVLFRGANIQKHRFRQDPTTPIWGRAPEYIQTQQGNKLLTSGFWGVARHVNYLGDLLMGLCWCLCCGLGRVLPFFFIIYFTVLLVHRERRDHDTCARKYGASWDEYCARVPWRILPGIY